MTQTTAAIRSLRRIHGLDDIAGRVRRLRLATREWPPDQRYWCDNRPGISENLVSKRHLASAIFGLSGAAPSDAPDAVERLERLPRNAIDNIDPSVPFMYPDTATDLRGHAEWWIEQLSELESQERDVISAQMDAAVWEMRMCLHPALVEITWRRTAATADAEEYRLAFGAPSDAGHPRGVRRTTSIEFDLIALCAGMWRETRYEEIVRLAVQHWRQTGGVEQLLAANPDLLDNLLNDLLSTSAKPAPGSARTKARRLERTKPAGSGNPTGFNADHPETPRVDARRHTKRSTLSPSTGTSRRPKGSRRPRTTQGGPPDDRYFDWDCSAGACPAPPGCVSTFG
jgi:hypothetical protein